MYRPANPIRHPDLFRSSRRASPLLAAAFLSVLLPYRGCQAQGAEGRCPDLPGYDETQEQQQGGVSLSLLSKFYAKLGIFGAGHGTPDTDHQYSGLWSCAASIGCVFSDRQIENVQHFQ